MTLPVGALPHDTFTLKSGGIVAFHSLSRKQTIDMRTFEDSPEEGEIHFLMWGTDSTREEVEAFRDNTTPGEVDQLLDKIIEISGINELRKKAAENGAGPKA